MGKLMMAAWLMMVGATTEPQDQTEEKPDEATGKLVALFQDAQRLGPWEQNRQLIVEATESIWRRNGWTSEPDEFARTVVGRINEHPPWQVEQRFQAFCQAMGERYGLDDSQEAALHAIATREVWILLIRHSREVLQVGREAVETRASGRPFGAEQVASWTKTMEPLVRDVRQTLDKSAAEFGQELRPEQREVMDRDVAAYRRRLGQAERLMRQWEAGRWQPADWGLEHDPLQVVAGQGQMAGKAVTTAPAAAPGPSPDAWEQYVQQFIARYGLDETQQVAARSILEEVRARAGGKTSEGQGGAVRQAQGGTVRQAQGEGRSRELFEELKRRLEGIPTQAQRERGGQGGG